MDGLAAPHHLVLVPLAPLQHWHVFLEPLVHLVQDEPMANQDDTFYLPANEATMAQQPLAQQPLAQQPLAQLPEAQQPEAQQPEAQHPEAQQPEAQQHRERQPLVVQGQLAAIRQQITAGLYQRARDDLYSRDPLPGVPGWMDAWPGAQAGAGMPQA